MSQNEYAAKARELLRRTKIVVAPDKFTLVALRREDWLKLLENPELSPRLSAPFMIFFDAREVTLLLDEIDFTTVRHAARGAKTESNFRLLTFDIELDFSVVGYLAAVTEILAEAGISIVALSSFSRDHVLIKQTDLAKALKVLSQYVEELC